MPLLDKRSGFHSSIAKQIEQRSILGAERLRALLKAICLRRTKDRLKLPEPEELTEDVTLAAEERTEYSRVGESFRRMIDDTVSGINQSKACNGLFQAILSLRIFCNHGTLVKQASTASHSPSSSTDETLSLLQQNDQAICAYCSCDITSIGQDNDPQSGIFTKCSHLLCVGCIEQNKHGNTKARKVCCPVCQTVSAIKVVKASRNQDVPHTPQILSGMSSKLEALYRNLISHPTEKRFRSLSNLAEYIDSH